MNYTGAGTTASDKKQGGAVVETLATTFCVGDLICNKNSSSFFAVVTSLDEFGIVNIVAIKLSPPGIIVTRGHLKWGDCVVAR